MNLVHRVKKLERNEAITGPRPLLEQYVEALDDPDSFLQKLSDADSERLLAEVVRDLFGGDAAAFEAFKTELLGVPAVEVADPALTEVATAEISRQPELTAGNGAGDPGTPLPDSRPQMPNGSQRPSWADLDAAERARLAESWKGRGPALPEGFKEWTKMQKAAWLDRSWPLAQEDEW